MDRYPKCFGTQAPHTIRFSDGSRIVVWASNDEPWNLSDIEELGKKCLRCSKDYMCFELSRSRDIFRGLEFFVV